MPIIHREIYLPKSMLKHRDKMEFIANNYSVDINYVRECVDKYGLLGSAKILSESLDKNVDNTYVAGTLYALHLKQNAMDIRKLYTDKPYLFNNFVNRFVLCHYDILSQELVHDRDYGYQFAAMKTIAKNYLFKYKGEPVESLQWAWMRIAVQVAAPDNWDDELKAWSMEFSNAEEGKKPELPKYLREIMNTYEILSKKEGIHATPTCINAGYCNPQLESCFLVRIGDSMLEIADVKKLLLMGSKCNGGFGIFMGDIRHSRVANRGITKGVIGLAKTINGEVPYADQLGSRPMAVNLILPIWHCDISTFITMKDENAPLDVRAALLNYTVSVPDLFRKRCLEGGNWSTFCPREAKMEWVKQHGGNPDNTHEVDAAPSLCDAWGDKFEEYYTMCEKAGIAKQVMKARDLDAGIHTYRAMIGEPYLFYIDNVNRKTNHQHMGTVVQTNLCTEIVEFTAAPSTVGTMDHLLIQALGEMVATCCLATINIGSLVDVKKDNNTVVSTFNWKRLGEITRQFTRNLDRVLDRTAGVLPNEGQKYIESVLQDDNLSDDAKGVAKELLKHVQKDPTYNSRKQTRAIGIGIMGLASCCALMGIEYASQDCLNLGTRIRACIEYHSKDESADLAHEIDILTGRPKGSYPTFEGSPMSKGILQHDMWIQETEYMKKFLSQIDVTPCSAKPPSDDEKGNTGDLIETYFKEFYEPDFVKLYKEAMKRYTWKEVDPSLFGVDTTWDDLREKVKKGLRNSLTTCQMPNATTSGAFGVSPSIEPFYEMYFTADNANGKDTTIYDALRDVFIAHGLYEPEKMASYLYENKGRIDGLHKIYPGDVRDEKSPKAVVKKLEKLFTSSFNINKKKYLLFIQMMGYYVDQAQSTNVFFEKPNAAYLARLSFMAWVNGAKTEYYLKRLAGTEKIDPFMEGKTVTTSGDVVGPVCTRRGDPDCIGCQ